MEGKNLIESLEKERSKLIRLIIESIKHGVSITQNKKILEQSRKCDALIVMIQKGKTSTIRFKENDKSF